jgi:hypothetical protein
MYGTITFVGVVHGNDVVVLDAGGGLGLAYKSCLRGEVGGVSWEHDLEGQPAVKAGVESGVDRPHAPAAEFFDDAERAEAADIARFGRRAKGEHGWGARYGLRRRLVPVTGDGPGFG